MVDVLLLRHKRSVESLISLHMVRVLDEITRDLVKQARAIAGVHPKLVSFLQVNWSLRTSTSVTPATFRTDDSPTFAATHAGT